VKNRPGMMGAFLTSSFADAVPALGLFLGGFVGDHPWSPAPILVRLPLHRRRIRVLALDPVRRAPGAIGRVAALRDDALVRPRGAEGPQHFQ
jgi:hypothetical protein